MPEFPWLGGNSHLQNVPYQDHLSVGSQNSENAKADFYAASAKQRSEQRDHEEETDFLQGLGAEYVFPVLHPLPWY